MTRWHSCYGGVFVFACALLLPPTLRGEDLLRWKFAAGDKFLLTTVQAQLVQGTAGEVKIVSRSQSLLAVQWTVEEVDADGSAKIAATFQRLSIDIAGPAALKFDTDSKDPPSDKTKELDAAIRPLVGTRFDLQVSPRGEFLSVKTPPASESALRRAAVLGRLGPIFTVAGATRLWRQALPMLPEKAVAVDAKWTDAYTSPTPLGELKTTMALTYAGAKKEGEPGVVAIGIVPTVTFADGTLESTAKTLEAGEKVEAKTKIVKDDSRGTALFDLAAGRPVQTEIEQNFAVETTRGTQTVKTELHTATRMTCKKL